MEPAEPAAVEFDSLLQVVLEGEAAGHPAVPNQQRDREQAIQDLRIGSHFVLIGATGPYVLHLAVESGRLVLAVHDAEDRLLRQFLLALSPFRRLIKDYQLLVESYETAMADGHTARVQTIDMGRRSLHDEGASMMIERLRGKAEFDFATARRLFTLVCVLHQRI